MYQQGALMYVGSNASTFYYNSFAVGVNVMVFMTGVHLAMHALFENSPRPIIFLNAFITSTCTLAHTHIHTHTHTHTHTHAYTYNTDTHLNIQIH